MENIAPAAGTTVEEQITQVARASYGRLVGILSAPNRDIAAAEDALSDAFQKALVAWVKSGIPDNPEAWLVRVARNRMTDVHRRALKQHPLPIEQHTLAMPEPNESRRRDPRIGLLFACAHPGIAEGARSPLMLQTVLGFTAAEIARAYVRSPAAISKLLSRAKARIKANAIPFQIPDENLRALRLQDVNEAIYGCYALVWMDGVDADNIQREAVYLADVLATEIQDDPEVLGLSSLLAFLYARRKARLDNGSFVPLNEQDTALWDLELTRAANLRLGQAFQLGKPGRFQLEAAIQSVHAARARTGQTDWPALLDLYQGLNAMAPTLGAQVGMAAVIAEVKGTAKAITYLDALNDDRLTRFQPYWATRAHLLAQSGQNKEALSAYDRAISLSLSKPLRNFLTAAKTVLT